jgi:2-iminobutanoate/2-iminopropanoate deaminase
MRQFIKNTEGVPKVNAPISQAVVVGKHCYISGQLATDFNGNYIEGTVLEEAQLAFDNIFAIAKASGFAVSDIVFIDLAFINLGDVYDINPLYDRLFPENKKPARTIYQAAALPYGGKIKVTAIAVKD